MNYLSRLYLSVVKDRMGGGAVYWEELEMECAQQVYISTFQHNGNGNFKAAFIQDL